MKALLLVAFFCVATQSTSSPGQCRRPRCVAEEGGACVLGSDSCSGARLCNATSSTCVSDADPLNSPCSFLALSTGFIARGCQQQLTKCFPYVNAAPTTCKPVRLVGDSCGDNEECLNNGGYSMGLCEANNGSESGQTLCQPTFEAGAPCR